MDRQEIIEKEKVGNHGVPDENDDGERILGI